MLIEKWHNEIPIMAIHITYKIYKIISIKYDKCYPLLWDESQNGTKNHPTVHIKIPSLKSVNV